MNPRSLYDRDQDECLNHNTERCSPSKELHLEIGNRIDGDGVLEGQDLRQAVAVELGVPVGDVAMMDGRLSGSDASLNATQASDEDGREWIDVLEDDSTQAADRFATTHDRAVLRDHLTFALQTLSPRERMIVRERQLVEAPRTLESLGLELKLSKERIRQLEAAAFAKLRRALEAQGASPREFLR